MARRVFSRTYDACAQKRFEEALTNGNIEQAVQLLERFPHYNSSPTDPIFRTLALIEGYRAITRAVTSLAPAEKEELSRFRALGAFEDLDEELREYRALGKPDELSEELRDYRALGKAEKIAGELELYRKIGTAEEAEKSGTELQELKDSIRQLH